MRSKLTFSQLGQLADFRRDALDALDAALPASTVYIDETVTVYATATGDDTTGTGSESAPFRTFAHACEANGVSERPGVKRVFDLTGLGDETPAGAALPAWVGSQGLGDPDVTIRADMQAVAGLSAAAQTFTPTALAKTNASTAYTVTCSTQSWPNIKALGSGYCKYAQWGDPDDELFYGIIHDNDGTHLYITCDDPPFGDISIVEPSARLICSGLNLCCQASVQFLGVSVIAANSDDPVYFNPAMIVYGSTVSFDHCTAERVWFVAPVYRYYTFCVDHVDCLFTGAAYISHSRFSGSDVAIFESPTQIVIKHGTVFEDVPGIFGFHLGAGGQYFGANLQIEGAWIKNASSDGIYWPGGTVVLKDMVISDCGRNALFFDGPMKVKLANITGSGSAGVGIKLDNGAQVEIVSRSGTGANIELVEDEGGNYAKLIGTAADFRNLMEGGHITILDATTPANNGTFEIYGADDEDENILYFANPDAVTEAFAGTWVVDPVDVTGTGGDYENGDKAADDYPAAPFSDLDVQYDGSEAGTAQATGTGSRIFNR